MTNRRLRGRNSDNTTQIANLGARRLYDRSGRFNLLNTMSDSHPWSISRKQCLNRRMTRFGNWIIVTSILLSTVHGKNKPRCDSHGYGQPKPESCTQLIRNEMKFENRISRLFSLETSIKPEGITKAQWSNRVELPFLRENGQSF